MAYELSWASPSSPFLLVPNLTNCPQNSWYFPQSLCTLKDWRCKAQEIRKISVMVFFLIITDLVSKWEQKCSHFHDESMMKAYLEQVDLCIVFLSAFKYNYSNNFYHIVNTRNSLWCLPIAYAPEKTRIQDF